jgi:hypothetical protein
MAEFDITKSAAPVSPVKAAATRMQQIKQEQDAKLEKLEATLSALTEQERKEYFFKNTDKDSVELVNILSARVDAMRDPEKRKEFFLAHPELEIRYSFANFIKE